MGSKRKVTIFKKGEKVESEGCNQNEERIKEVDY
jgi:hypothetical protein